MIVPQLTILNRVQTSDMTVFLLSFNGVACVLGHTFNMIELRMHQNQLCCIHIVTPDGTTQDDHIAGSGFYVHTAFTTFLTFLGQLPNDPTQETWWTDKAEITLIEDTGQPTFYLVYEPEDTLTIYTRLPYSIQPNYTDMLFQPSASDTLYSRPYSSN